MFVELTIVNFSWYFNPAYAFFSFSTIWALGLCMVVLAGAIYLPKKIIFGIALLILGGHNLLDGIRFEGNGLGAVLWATLHEQKTFDYGSRILRVNYPILSWIPIMMLGYLLGDLYKKEVVPERRKKTLLKIGIGTVFLFVVLRAINVYGDHSPWARQDDPVFTVLSFLATTKYPPSLLFALMTLGPCLIFLSIMERSLGKWSAPVLVFGRVPMFFYILHLYLIHALATVALVLNGNPFTDTVIKRGLVAFHPEGYGFPLWVVYVVWVAVILMLYPLCAWYDRYKTSHKDQWWLSYL